MKKINKQRDLEESLQDLHKRSVQMREELEEDNDYGDTGDERYIEHQQLLDEYELLQAYIKDLKEISKESSQSLKHTAHRKMVEIGKKILLANSKFCLKFHLVESVNPYEKNAISSSSPLGIAILGKKVGDIIRVCTPHGIIKYSILGMEQ